jgi:Tfp pilus assembly protein PilO
MMEDFRSWILIHSAVTLVIVLVLGVALWYLRSDISARVASIISMQEQISVRLRASGILAVMKKQKEEALKFEPKLQEFLPLRDHLVTLPRDLSRLATARGVEFGFSFGTESQPQAESAGSISFTLTAGGTLSSVLAFLEDIERSSLIIRLEDVDISGDGSRYSLLSHGKVFFR